MPASATGRIAPGSRLAIVRPGEEFVSAEESLGGHESCRGLTAARRRQEGALAARLWQTGELARAVALYSSGLRRAIETAEILAKALGGLEIWQTCSLCERHVGGADAMTWSDGEQLSGRAVPGRDDHRQRSPGAEAWAGFLEWPEAALYEVMAAQHGGRVAAAGHGGPIGASVARLLGLPGDREGFRGYADNCSLTGWEWTGRRWWLVGCNDGAHLGASKWAPTAGLRLPPPGWMGEEAGPATPQQA